MKEVKNSGTSVFNEDEQKLIPILIKQLYDSQAAEKAKKEQEKLDSAKKAAGKGG